LLDLHGLLKARDPVAFLFKFIFILLVLWILKLFTEPPYLFGEAAYFFLVVGNWRVEIRKLEVPEDAVKLGTHMFVYFVQLHLLKALL